MSSSGDPPGVDGQRVLVYNPESGTADHGELIRSLASEYGYDVRETESGADAVQTAADAATEASVVAAAGGDGTLTRVVRGIDRADAFDDTLFGVVPAGTGNNFATNVGVDSIEDAFEIIEGGERRRIDVGIIDDLPFLNSVVAGLTAESSAETDSDSKERWGVLAYVMATARTASEFDGLSLIVDPAGENPRELDAKVVLVGNGRSFPHRGRSQANMEDGLLEVAVIEDVSTLQLLEDSLEEVLGEGSDHIERFTTPELHVTLEGTSSRVSIDGEIEEESRMELTVRERILRLPVGTAYDPEPYM